MPTRPTIVPRAAPAAPPNSGSKPDAPAPVEPTTEQRLFSALQQQANELADYERRYGRVSRERDQLREVAQQQSEQINALRKQLPEQ